MTMEPIEAGKYAECVYTVVLIDLSQSTVLTLLLIENINHLCPVNKDFFSKFGITYSLRLVSLHEAEF